jgi:hypothetical protein
MVLFVKSKAQMYKDICNDAYGYLDFGLGSNKKHKPQIHEFS